MKNKTKTIIGALLFPFLWMILGFLLYHAGILITGGALKEDGWIAVSTFISLFIVILSYVVYYEED